MNELRANSPESWLETVWHALGGFRENCIPEGEDNYDREWNEICTAMAWIREELGLPDEVEQDQTTNKTFIVTIDVVGRYKVLIDTPDHDQAADFAVKAMDKGEANIVWCDDSIDVVDTVEN